jgi:hypothetical protein
MSEQVPQFISIVCHANLDGLITKRVVSTGIKEKGETAGKLVCLLTCYSFWVVVQHTEKKDNFYFACEWKICYHKRSEV